MVLTVLQHAYESVASAGATLIIAVAGLVISAINITYTIWDKIATKRLRLATGYFFTGQEGAPDTITIVNLSPFPVHVAFWRLRWRPALFHPFISSVEAGEAEPDDSAAFIIPAHNSYALNFYEPDKFDTSYRTARNRRLYLTLDIFGHGRKTLKVYKGT